jgi:NADPH2:quinone reductase
MRAAWYERRGEAADVLVVGETDALRPGPGELRIRVHASGINPGDVKKRARAGAPMPFPRVIPHSDGAGIVDAVGPGGDLSRVGERVWCFGAQSYRPFGTAAELVVVPAWQAVPLPEHATFEQGACLGIPGITGHRAVFADGAVDDQTVLVVGATGAVGSMAAALARWGGARVLALVRDPADVDRARDAGAERVFLASEPELAAQIRDAAPDGVDRIVDVAFATYAELYADVIAQGGVIASYFSTRPAPTLPFWPLLFLNVTIRLLGSDDFPPDAKRSAAADLTACLRERRLALQIGETLPLEQIAAAHQAVEGGKAGRVVLTPNRPGDVHADHAFEHRHPRRARLTGSPATSTSTRSPHRLAPRRSPPCSCTSRPGRAPSGTPTRTARRSSSPRASAAAGARVVPSR